MSRYRTFLQNSTAVTLLSLILASPAVVAQPVSDEAAMDVIVQMLSATQPDMVVREIGPSPVPGMFTVTLQNMQTIHVTRDGRYLIPGDLYEAGDGGASMVNLGEEVRNKIRVERLAEIPESEMIIFPAKGESLATLTAFTDLDCPYCRKLHGEIDQLNNMGITVHYLAFPREGLEGPTYDKMVSTWCSDDPVMFMTTAKRGADVPAATCDNPIARHYQLGRELGVQGTPALVMENGYMVNGYVPAETLREFLLFSR